MEGVVDAVVRDRITAIGGVDLCVTEFVRVTHQIIPDKEFFKYCPELRSGSRTPSGIPVLVQLLGGQPDMMAANAERAVELGAIGIDLNFGCPAKTVNRHDGGATLLKNPERIFAVVRAVRNTVPQELSVSAKVRLGFSDKSLCREIAAAAVDAGASWLTVHARTRDEGYRPPAHWEYIAQMRLDVPLIANGEIWSEADAQNAQVASQCRHLMLGRGIISNPWLALEIKAAQRQNSRPSVHGEDIKNLTLQIAEQSRLYRNESYGLGRLKQWLRFQSRNFPWSAQAFDRVKVTTSYSDAMTALLPQLSSTQDNLRN